MRTFLIILLKSFCFLTHPNYSLSLDSNSSNVKSSIVSRVPCSDSCNITSWKHVGPEGDRLDPKSEQFETNEVWISKIFSDTMWTFTVKSSDNPVCIQQSLAYLSHLKNNTLWAARMLDSSLLTPVGLVSGDDVQYGNPDQCTSTKIPLPGFSTKYCLPRANFAPHKRLYPEYYVDHTKVWPPYDMAKSFWDFNSPRDEFIRHRRDSFRWGLCLLESCSTGDIQKSLNDTLFLAFAQHNIHFEVELNPVDCYSEEKVKTKRMPLPGMIWMVVMVVLLVFAAIGTSLEYLDSSPEQEGAKEAPKPGRTKSFFLVFSFKRNSNFITRPGGPGDITVIDGVKGFMMVTIMMFHSAMFSLGYSKNLEFYEEALHSVKYFLLSNTSQFLDTFFFWSGFLLASSVVKTLNKNSSVKYGRLIVNRVLRIYPMYILVLVFNAWVVPYLGYGPLWMSYTDAEADYCRRNWWQNLLFISSLLPNQLEMCMPSTWYLSTDFQLFLISLLLIYCVSKYPAHRTSILIGACVVAHIVPSVVIYFSRGLSLWMLSIREFRDHVRIPGGYTGTLYSKFYIRMPPYILGVCTAYAGDYLIKKKFRMSQIQKAITFLVTFGLTTLVLILGAFFYLPGLEYNVWYHVVHAIPYRFVTASSLAVGIVVHVCCGYGALSSFFTLRLWVVLGRLSYHMYLLNFMLIPLDIHVGQNSNFVNFYLYILRALGDVTFLSLLAYVSTLLVEPPMEKLRKRYLPR